MFTFIAAPEMLEKKISRKKKSIFFSLIGLRFSTHPPIECGASLEFLLMQPMVEV